MTIDLEKLKDALNYTVHDNGQDRRLPIKQFNIIYEAAQAWLQSPIQGQRDRNIPLERLKMAIAFYANRNHWMALGSEGNNIVFTAIDGKLSADGYSVAESVQNDLWAIGQMFEMLERNKEELEMCLDNRSAALAQDKTPVHIADRLYEALKFSLGEFDYRIDDCEEALSAYEATRQQQTQQQQGE